MYLTVHAAAAAVISQQVGNPWLVFLLGWISHLFIDFIPHGDENNLDQSSSLKPQLKKLYKIVLIDFIGVLAVSIWFIFFTTNDSLNYLFALAGATIPDLMTGFKVLAKEYWQKEFKVINFLHSIHQGIHHIIKNKLKFTVTIPTGLFIQITFFIILIFISIR